MGFWPGEGELGPGETALTHPYPELGSGVNEPGCEGGHTEDGRREAGQRLVSILLAPPDTQRALAGGHSDSPALSPSFVCNQEAAAGEPRALSAESYTLPEAEGEAEEGS